MIRDSTDYATRRNSKRWLRRSEGGSGMPCRFLWIGGRPAREDARPTKGDRLARTLALPKTMGSRKSRPTTSVPPILPTGQAQIALLASRHHEFSVQNLGR